MADSELRWCPCIHCRNGRRLQIHRPESTAPEATSASPRCAIIAHAASTEANRYNNQSDTLGLARHRGVPTTDYEFATRCVLFSDYSGTIADTI